MSSTARTRPRHRTALLVATCAVSVGLAVPSYAAAVGEVVPSGDTVRVTGAADVENEITITTALGTIAIEDAADTLTSNGNPLCAGDGTNTVVCADPGLARWEADLGNLDDGLEALGPLPGYAYGSDGADQLIAGDGATGLFGDAGADVLIGGPNADVIFGGSDADLIVGKGGDDSADASGLDADVVSLGEGSDWLRGAGRGTADLGPGDDTYMYNLDSADAVSAVDGGAGTDSITGFSQNPPFFSVTIDLAAGTLVAKAPDAQPSSVKGFEDVSATVIGGDTITGTAGPNLIVTGASPVLRFFATAFAHTEIPNFADTVDPGAGPDVVGTGDGDDAIALVDGFADRVDCGDGADTVKADQLDVFEDCENVTTEQVGVAVADVKPPVCGFTRASKRVKRKAFLKGYAATFRCDEQVTAIGRMAITAKARKGEVVIAKAGDVTLAEKTAQAAAGAATKLTLKPPRKLGRALPKRFAVRVVIDARDELGNSTTLTRRVTVTTPKAKKKAGAKRERR